MRAKSVEEWVSQSVSQSVSLSRRIRTSSDPSSEVGTDSIKNRSVVKVWGRMQPSLQNPKRVHPRLLPPSGGTTELTPSLPVAGVVESVLNIHTSGVSDGASGIAPSARATVLRGKGCTEDLYHRVIHVSERHVANPVTPALKELKCKDGGESGETVVEFLRVGVQKRLIGFPVDLDVEGVAQHLIANGVETPLHGVGVGISETGIG